MKDEVNWKGQIYEMEWFDSVDFESLDNVMHVYGHLFDEDGNLCVVDCCDGRWVLPGGHVEECDKSFEDTLIREVAEEADLKIKNIRRLGFWRASPVSDNCTKGVHHVVDFVADVDEVLEQTPDPCHGKMNVRKFISPDEFSNYVKLGKTGDFQIKKVLEFLEKE